MKKVIYNLAMVAVLSLSTAVTAQVSISTNNEDPKATLDVSALKKADVADGILIPRVSKDYAQSMHTPEISTLVYINDVSGTGGNRTTEIDADGFYYFDGTRWKKVGGEKKKFTARLDQALTTDYDWTDGGKGLVDYYEITSISGAFKLPDPTKHKGAIIHYKNSTGGTIVYSGPNGINVPNDTNSITASSAQIIWSDGKKWYLIGGRN